jgi:isocitrate dehydrogenase kinase/phosphatase
VHSTFPQDIAEIINDGFSEYRNEFKAITAQAKRRFENAEWIAAKQASIDRIEIYDVFAASVVEKILFDYRYWQGLQENVKGNWMMDVFPYRREQRFEHNE